MKIYCFLFLFLFIGIHVGDLNPLDSDVQFVNRRPAYSNRENILNMSRRKSKRKSERQRKKRKEKSDRMQIRRSQLGKIAFEYIRKNKAYVPKDGGNSGAQFLKSDILDAFLKGIPKTTEPPVMTSYWLNMSDDYEKYLILLRNSSADARSLLGRIAFEYIRNNKAYVPKGDSNAGETFVKAEKSKRRKNSKKKQTDDSEKPRRNLSRTTSGAE
uniref:Uncharacterized protein n=1 Tax=Trichobilharzia regenti TaxID=157069 RepID=A0AA85ISH6_TRIRE|nr:unnamed protein product [Trichobilharzia regenti]